MFYGRGVRYNQNDEYETPKWAVKEATKLLPDDITTIWEPFPMMDGKLPEALEECGYDVVETYTDFFRTDPPDCDVVLSNPPFSRKVECIERLIDLDIPFVCIVPVGMLTNQNFMPAKKKANGNLAVVWPSARINFLRDGHKVGTAPFQSVYLLYKMPPCGQFSME